MILSFVGNPTDLKELTDNELVEMLETPNLNSTSKNQINVELLNRLKPIKP